MLPLACPTARCETALAELPDYISRVLRSFILAVVPPAYEDEYNYLLIRGFRAPFPAVRYVTRMLLGILDELDATGDLQVSLGGAPFSFPSFNETEQCGPDRQWRAKNSQS